MFALNWMEVNILLAIYGDDLLLISSVAEIGEKFLKDILRSFIACVFGRLTDLFRLLLRTVKTR